MSWHFAKVEVGHQSQSKGVGFTQFSCSVQIKKLSRHKGRISHLFPLVSTATRRETSSSICHRDKMLMGALMNCMAS